MATTKSAKATAKPARPRATVKKKTTAAVAPKRTRRAAGRRVAWEHLGHPSSAVVVTGGASGIGQARITWSVIPDVAKTSAPCGPGLAQSSAFGKRRVITDSLSAKSSAARANKKSAGCCR